MAPFGASIMARNAPLGCSAAATPFTVTFATGSPLALGIAVPVPVICPAPLCISPRAGDVTGGTGGAGASPPRAKAVEMTARPIQIGGVGHRGCEPVQQAQGHL